MLDNNPSSTNLTRAITTAVLVMGAIAVHWIAVHWVAAQLGHSIAAVTEPLFYMLVISISVINSVASRRVIPFGAGIEKPPKQRLPGLLPVLCAAASKHLQKMIDAPACTPALITQILQHFITPPPPTRGGLVAICLTPRLTPAPSARLA